MNINTRPSTPRYLPSQPTTQTQPKESASSHVVKDLLSLSGQSALAEPQETTPRQPWDKFFPSPEFNQVSEKANQIIKNAREMPGDNIWSATGSLAVSASLSGSFGPLGYVLSLPRYVSQKVSADEGRLILARLRAGLPA